MARMSNVAARPLAWAIWTILWSLWPIGPSLILFLFDRRNLHGPILKFKILPCGWQLAPPNVGPS